MPARYVLFYHPSQEGWDEPYVYVDDGSEF